MASGSVRRRPTLQRCAPPKDKKQQHMESNKYRRTTTPRKRRKLRNPRNAAALRPPNQRPRTKTKTRKRRSPPPKRPRELHAARKPPRKKKKKRDPTTLEKRMMTSPRRRNQRNPLLKEAVLANPLLQIRKIPRQTASQLAGRRESLLLRLLLTSLSLSLKRRPSLLKRSPSVDVRRSLPRSFLHLLYFYLLVCSMHLHWGRRM